MRTRCGAVITVVVVVRRYGKWKVRAIVGRDGRRKSRTTITDKDLIELRTLPCFANVRLVREEGPEGCFYYD